MIALSIQQPWAWLIVNGYKDIENRTWPTTFRGKFLVHTGKRFDRDGYDWIVEQKLARQGIILPEKSELLAQCGGIVGNAVITDCVQEHDSKWFFGPYGFVLDVTKSKPGPFVPYRGRLGFFDVEV